MGSYQIKKSSSSFFQNVVAVMFALRAITYVLLAFTSTTYNMPWYSFIINGNLYLSVFVGFLYLLIKQKNFCLKNCVYLVPLFFYYGFCILHTYKGYGGENIHELIAIACFILFDKETKIKTFKALSLFLVIGNLISLVLFFLSVIGFQGFQNVVFYSDGVRMGTYQKWFIFALLKDSSVLIRMCGIFNEPGALGTVSALVFAATYKRVRLSWSVVLLLSILFSFSMAGYILLLVFMAIQLGKRNYFNYFWVGLILLALLYIPYIDFGNEWINFFVKRFAFQDGSLVGDNRVTSSFMEELTQMLTSNQMWFGKGFTYTFGSGSSSWLNLIMEFGVVGTTTFVGSWVYAYIKCSEKNKECLLLLLIFLLALYQRPRTIMNSYGYILMIGAQAFLLEVCTIVHKRKQIITQSNYKPISL